MSIEEVVKLIKLTEKPKVECRKSMLVPEGTMYVIDHREPGFLALPIENKVTLMFNIKDETEELMKEIMDLYEKDNLVKTEWKKCKNNLLFDGWGVK